MERILDLKEHLHLLPQYVELRNSYSDLLLSQSVEISESVQWIKNTTAEIRVVEEENLISGVVLLYIDRGGEVAFFARQKNKGIGTLLLRVADEVARQVQLPSTWAWVREDNVLAARVFEKSGYCVSGCEERTFKNQLIRGIRYTKTLAEKNN